MQLLQAHLSPRGHKSSPPSSVRPRLKAQGQPAAAGSAHEQQSSLQPPSPPATPSSALPFCVPEIHSRDQSDQDLLYLTDLKACSDFMSRKGNRNNTPYEVKKGHYLVGNCGIYKVLQFLGEGTYGKVAKCIKFGTQEMYAIKIMKNNKAGQKEVESMKLIEHLDPEENHLVQMYECFSFQNMTCIVYELLGNSLFQVMCDQPDPVHLHGIRAFARDGLKALKALKRIGLAHCDIKIDNIMVANTSYINLKLIDFGMATKTKDLSVGTEIQVTPFKSPEVILGLPLDEGVDMWAFGMVLASLYFGEYPFPSETEYETIRAMVQIHGLPEAEMIRKARFKKAFFTRDNDGWRLCTPDEYTQATRIPVEDKNHVTNLDEMIDDHKVFIDLLKCMLEINPKNRITPSQALAHDFITMKHLAGKRKAGYAAIAKEIMEDAGLKSCTIFKSKRK
uniref:Protein kinase domain-containing protein n=1 Tax=Oryzias melastigma TaxID=30732 RepID=A0A3B3D3M1_ORYME